MPQKLLMPGGLPLGQPGTSPDIREVSGGANEAQVLFGALTHGGISIVKPAYPGTLFQVPGGGIVGMRPISKSGSPTIDVNIPGIPIRKIKFI